MQRIYNSLRSNELPGSGSVSSPVSALRSLVVGLACCAPVAACATVSVYEPVTAEISLTEDQSQLQKDAESYSKDTREKGLATGEASLSSIADMLAGKQSDANAYWRRIGADRSAPAGVVSRVREDMNVSAVGLAKLDALARQVIGQGELGRVDVLAFERALIHARQARDSFSDALVHVNRRAESEYQVTLELAPLDAALARARVTADDLAAARTEYEASSALAGS
jgi:hypothetical protein